MMPKHLTGVGLGGGGGNAVGPWKGRKFVACEVELLVVHAGESNEKGFLFLAASQNVIFVTLLPRGLAKGELREPMLNTSPANRGRLRLKTFHCKKTASSRRDRSM